MSSCIELRKSLMTLLQNGRHYFDWNASALLCENSRKSLISNIDLIGNYSISKFDKDFIYYEITFNSTPKNFINIMSDKNFNFDTQKKVWVLK